MQMSTRYYILPHYRLTRKWFSIAYLMPGRSLALVAMLTDSGHSFSTISSGPHMDLFCPMKDFLAGQQKARIICVLWYKTLDLGHFKSLNSSVPKVSIMDRVTFQPMFEAVLQDDKELLQGRIFRVQRPAQTQGGLNQYFDA